MKKKLKWRTVRRTETIRDGDEGTARSNKDPLQAKSEAGGWVSAFKLGRIGELGNYVEGLTFRRRINHRP